MLFDCHLCPAKLENLPSSCDLTLDGTFHVSRQENGVYFYGGQNILELSANTSSQLSVAQIFCASVAAKTSQCPI